MRLFRRYSAAVLAATAVATSVPLAHAADLGGAPPVYPAPADYRAPPRNGIWTGFYLGGTYGWSGGTNAVNGGSGAFDTDLSGSLGSVFAGYNYQMGGTVIGLEGDIGTGPFDGATGVVSSELNSFGSIRARAGVLLSPSFLLYATGGLALASFDFKTNGITQSQSFAGYQVGAGTELMFAPQWTLRLEYLYTGLGSEQVSHGGLVNSYEPDYHTVRAGVALKF